MTFNDQLAALLKTASVVPENRYRGGFILITIDLVPGRHEYELGCYTTTTTRGAAVRVLKDALLKVMSE